VEVGSLDPIARSKGEIGSSPIKHEISRDNDILNIVLDINAQVLNIAGKIAAEIIDVFGQNGRAKTTELDREMANEIADVVGPKMTDIVMQTDFMEDPTPIQLAIQSLLVNGIYTILLTWPLKPFDHFSVSFWKLYESIVCSGECNIVKLVSNDSQNTRRGAARCFTLEGVGVQVPQVRPRCN